MISIYNFSQFKHLYILNSFGKILHKDLIKDNPNNVSKTLPRSRQAVDS